MAHSKQWNFYSRIRSAPAIILMLTAAVGLAVGFHKGPYLVVNTIVMGGMLAMVSMGLALVFGVMNIAQFAHGEYFMIGTLVAYYIFPGLHRYAVQHANGTLAGIAPLIGIFGALFAGVVTGALTEMIIFSGLRRRSLSNWVMNTFLITLGLSVIMVNSHQLLFGVNPKGITRYWSGRPFDIMGLFMSRDRVFALVIAAIIVAAFWAFMKYSETGKAIRCVSQNETGALIVGINLSTIQIVTMSLSCGLAAVAGASLLFMYPSYPTVGLEPLYMAWFVVILAGLGNVAGAAACSFIVALLKIVTIEYVGMGWDYVFPTAFITLILIIKPNGLFGSVVRGVHNE